MKTRKVEVLQEVIVLLEVRAVLQEVRAVLQEVRAVLQEVIVHLEVMGDLQEVIVHLEVMGVLQEVREVLQGVRLIIEKILYLIKIKKVIKEYTKYDNHEDYIDEDYSESKKGDDFNELLYKKLNKPFYKKPWFIIVIIIVACSVIYGIGTSGDDKKDTSKLEKSIEKAFEDTDESGDTSTEDTTGDNSEKVYALGEQAVVNDVAYTLNSVETTDERNIFDDSEPANVIKVSYTVENKSNHEVSVGISDLEVYDSEDKKLDSYPNEHTIDTIAKGKKIDAVQYFSANSLGNMELQFSPVLSWGKSANFKVDVK